MNNNPLAEVFGFPIDNKSKEAERCRKNKFCPFNNKVPSCTKDKANNPLGVCSIFEGENKIITCPIRFREDWSIAEHAAEFFFGTEDSWTSLTEVKLNDKFGNAAGNIDIVLVSYDDRGMIKDFGSLEIQAVYISGNVRNPFEKYLTRRNKTADFNWEGPNPPRADFLSSSRKRLAPQMLYKGGILKSWQKKQAVALQTVFFETLPTLKEVTAKKADIAWILYDLKMDTHTNRFKLIQERVVFTEFDEALRQITTTEPGRVEDFMEVLQHKLDDKLEGNPPDAPTLTDITLS